MVGKDSGTLRRYRNGVKSAWESEDNRRALCSDGKRGAFFCSRIDLVVLLILVS